MAGLSNRLSAYSLSDEKPAPEDADAEPTDAETADGAPTRPRKTDHRRAIACGG